MMPTRIGSYQVLLELGRGGMGTVYLGRAVGAGGFERLVAIKRAHAQAKSEELSERFLNEARLAAHVHHANVVGTQQAGRDDEGLYLVCDYVEGESLRGLVERAAARREKAPTGIVLRIALDGLAGLHAAHEAVDASGAPLGMLHRDVSADNLLVGRDGVTRLADFGIAKSAQSSLVTEQGLRHGKLMYFSPEYVCMAPTDRTLDIYAMGVTLWIALAGRDPWPGKDEAQILHAIVSDGLPQLASAAVSLPTAFDVVISRACHRDPAQRYQTARQMLDALEAIGKRSGAIASHVRVAEYVETTLGAELALRRERIRLRRGELDVEAAPQVERPQGWPLPEPAATDASELAPRRAQTGWRWALAVLVLLGGGYVVFGLARSERAPVEPAQPLPAPRAAGEAPQAPAAEPASSSDPAVAGGPVRGAEAEPAVRELDATSQAEKRAAQLGAPVAHERPREGEGERPREEVRAREGLGERLREEVRARSESEGEHLSRRRRANQDVPPASAPLAPPEAPAPGASYPITTDNPYR